MKRFVGLMLVKSQSNRLPGKNIKDFRGKQMFLWNLEKCLSVFGDVYVSSDSQDILDIAFQAGAKGILRGEELCGDCPDIPVFQHALKVMPHDVDGIVAVHANNPTLEKSLILLTRMNLEMGAQEVMTCHPMSINSDYKLQHNKINGSIRAMTRGRLENYKDAYHPEPDILLVDTSIEIETQYDFDKALLQ